jgi:S-adenosylmethionine:tRNA ribosyltransferase-isomerase
VPVNRKLEIENRRSPEAILPEVMDFDLPTERIARYPSVRRDSCKLMVVRRSDGSIKHHRFRDLRSLLSAPDVLVLNATSVAPARLRARKSTGARVELLIVSEQSSDTCVCLVKPSKRVGPGVKLLVGGQVLLVTGPAGVGKWILRTADGTPFLKLMREWGEVPLPPYLRRCPIDLDRRWYQTVFAREPGSVAAPTAGLHFTPSLLEALRRKGVRVCEVIVHLGTGSFVPPEREPPGPEFYRVTARTASLLNKAREAGARIVAVGTSTARALETCGQADRTLRPGQGMTEKIITPPHRFRGLDCLLTNFHLPGSSHLMVVEALVGRDLLLRAHEEAIGRGYRFYSYGDAMLIL